MGVSFTSDVLLGILIGAGLVLLAQPLFRAFGKASKWLPLVLLVAVLVFALLVWTGR
jgi:hypothetical protein